MCHLLSLVSYPDRQAMDLLVQGVLVIHLLFIYVHQSTSRNTDPAFYYDDGNCWLYYSTLESNESLKQAENCTQLNLNSVNITEPTRELFDGLGGEFHSLRMFSCSVEAVYLPPNLTVFQISGTPGTQIVIGENSTYKLEEFKLDTLPQLPVNMDKLRQLKNFECSTIPEERVDFTVFGEMTQLEKIAISGIADVTIPDSVQLQSLRVLTIDDTRIASFPTTLSLLSNLQILHLNNNSLHAAAKQFSTLKNLTHLSVSRNNLRRVTMEAFANMSKLETLILTDDHIYAIKTQNMVQLPRLRSLSLDSNFLSTLDTTLWIFPALQHLSLINNHLKQVEGLLTLLSATAHSQSFLMFGNPWDSGWLNETERQINGTQLFVSKNASHYPSSEP